jgi:hypothetical protein
MYKSHLKLYYILKNQSYELTERKIRKEQEELENWKFWK